MFNVNLPPQVKTVIDCLHCYGVNGLISLFNYLELKRGPIGHQIIIIKLYSFISLRNYGG